MGRWNWGKILAFPGKHWPLTVFFILGCALIMTPHKLERHFIYYPTQTVRGNPSMMGLDYEDLALKTEDSINLHGWFIPAPDADKTIMIFHGNAGNIGDRLEWMVQLRGLGTNVMIVDYRGYGKSEGDPYEEGLYRDARAAYQWWHSRRAGAAEKLILLGESLGGSVAVDLAQRADPTGLIVQSTFTNAADMARQFFPLGLLRPLLGIQFDSAAKIKNVTCPKLFIHGNKDEIVPFRIGCLLYDLAAPPKSFYEVEGAGHNDLIWVGGAEYLERIRAFLSTL